MRMFMQTSQLHIELDYNIIEWVIIPSLFVLLSILFKQESSEGEIPHVALHLQDGVH